MTDHWEEFTTLINGDSTLTELETYVNNELNVIIDEGFFED